MHCVHITAGARLIIAHMSICCFSIFGCFIIYYKICLLGAYGKTLEAHHLAFRKVTTHCTCNLSFYVQH